MAPPVCIQLLCVWICFPTCSAGNIELSVSNTEFFIFLPPKYSPLTLPLLVNSTLSLSATSFPLIYPNVRNFSSIICYPSLLLCFCCFSPHSSCSLLCVQVLESRGTLKVWFPDQQLPQHLGACQKCTSLGPNPDLQNRKLLGRGPESML